jgi:hypothetical protein
MSALAELDVHVNNEGDDPVFSLGVKEAAYDPSMPVSGARFLKLEGEVELKKLTTLVDLSTFRKLGRCTVLVRHNAKGASPDNCIRAIPVARWVQMTHYFPQALPAYFIASPRDRLDGHLQGHNGPRQVPRHLGGF